MPEPDDMVNPELDNKPTIDPPQPPAVYLHSGIDQVLAQAINLTPEYVMHEPTCPICQSANREDIEQKWLETKNHADVKELMKSKGMPELSNEIINNHMTYHYERGIQEIVKTEYIDRIKRLNNTPVTTLERIDLCLSALTERLIGVNSITPSGEMSVADIEKIKSAEVSRLMTSFNSLIKLQASIRGEMQSNGELLMIPRQSFTDFFKTKILEAKTDDEKKIIMDLLNGLKDLGKNAG